MEPEVEFMVTRRELSLIKEIADEFLLNVPEAEDVVALLERVTATYNASFA